MSQPFKRSTYCGNGACVEVSGTRVRDGKDRHGAVLAFSAPAWGSFLASDLIWPEHPDKPVPPPGSPGPR